MKKSVPIILVLSVLFVILALVFTIVETVNKDISVEIKPSSTPTPIALKYTYPINNRSFLMGTAGFVPVGFPNPKVDDVNEFWLQTSLAGELHGIHVDWQETEIIEPSIKSTSVDIVLALGLQRPTEWNDSIANEFAELAIGYLDEYPEIKYLGVGNEMNIRYEEHPDQFDQFVETYEVIYDLVKAKHPDVYVYTIFQYETLRGDGYLTGNSDQRDPEWELISRFGKKLDLIAITTYPYFDFTEPELIPDSYFKDIEKYSDKPIAIVETGWMARESYGSQLAPLSEQGFTGSEQEQVDYFMRLLELTAEMNVELIDWVWINDIAQWENGTDSQSKEYPIFDSIGLKYNDGKEKEIWNVWTDFLQLPITNKNTRERR